MGRMIGPPRGTFMGNFVTPYVVGHSELWPGTWAEFSTGDGIMGGVLWGVTIRRAGGERLDPDPSTCFHSKREAYDYAASLKERSDEVE